MKTVDDSIPLICIKQSVLKKKSSKFSHIMVML